jgi:major intrinsic protein
MCWCVARSQRRMSVLTSERTRLYSMQQTTATLIEPARETAIKRSPLHWPEYLMEAASVALFLFLTCLFAGLLLSPTTPIRHVLRRPVGLRALMGLAVGGTIVAIVMSPWGQRSGGHFNPALTVAFYRLRKMDLQDAFFIWLHNSLARSQACVLSDFYCRTRLAGAPCATR